MHPSTSHEPLTAPGTPGTPRPLTPQSSVHPLRCDFSTIANRDTLTPSDRDRIAQRAYEIYLAQGLHPGHRPSR